MTTKPFEYISDYSYVDSRALVYELIDLVTVVAGGGKDAIREAHRLNSLKKALLDRMDALEAKSRVNS